MSENDDTIQVPPSLTFETLGYLANHPLIDDPNESRPVETYANELITNIIKDASQAASQNPSENFDNTGMNNTNESDFPPTSKENQSENTITNLDKSEYSTSNGIHDEKDFDNEEIQNKMNNVINDIQVRSRNDTITSRKSVASNHLHDDQANNSTPTITNPLSNNSTESPSDADDIFGIKPAPTDTTVTIDDSIDQHQSEQENHKYNPLDNSDDFFNTKTRTIDDDDQHPTSTSKQNVLDETTRFGTSSPPRVQSASSKRSVPVTPDEPSTSGDEKRLETSPSKLPDDTGNDTDLDNREVANIARRPSRAMSPLNRPRSPTPNDSRKVSNTNEPSPSFFTEQSQSPTHLRKDDETNQSPILSDDNQQKQIFEPPTAIISPASRRESTNHTDQQQTSRRESTNHTDQQQTSRRESTNHTDQQQTSRRESTIKTKFDENSFEPSTSRPNTSRTSQFITTDEQSKLITEGEQLQIPTDDFDNERINSPPPLSPDIKSSAVINPLLGSSLVHFEQDHSRPPSETDRKSPTTSMISNEKVIGGDVLSSKSRRESNISKQQTDNSDQQPKSRHGSQILEQTPQISGSRRASTSQQQDELDSHREQEVPSRRTSNVPQESTSHRGSFVPEQQISSRRESITLEQKPSSRKESTTSEQQVSSKRASVISEQQISHRRESIHDEQKIVSRKGSIIPEQQPSSHRGSFVDEQKTFGRRESTTDEPQVSSKRASVAPEQRTSSRRGSIVDEQKTSSRPESTTFERKPPSRKGSTTSDQQAPSKRSSVAPEQQAPSRRESTVDEQKTISRKPSTVSEQQPPSKRGSFAADQQISHQRESHISDQQISHRRESSFDQQEQKIPSKPVSRKASVVEQQQITSRRESQQQASSSRRTSTNQDNQFSSPRRSNNVHISSSQESSRRNSVTKQEQQPIPVLVNKDRRGSSLNINDTNHQQIKHSSNKEVLSSDTDDVPIRTSAKHKQESASSSDQRRKSSLKVDENDHRRSSFQRRAGQESKRNSNLITDEIVVTPIIKDSSKVRQHNGKRPSITNSSHDQTSTSNFPPVNSSFQQEKPRRSEILNQQQISTSNRFENTHVSSSHDTTASENEQPTHWTKQIIIPSIHLTDDEIGSSREDQTRPQSPNVEQIAERNQPPSPALIKTSTGKKRSGAEKGGQKRKEQQRLSRRSTSADTVTNIPLVDDKSLDSASENNTDFDRQKRRHIKPKKKDVETNTDQIFDSHQQHRSFFDEKELIPQQPLKATKPMSDHLHSIRRRAPNKQQILTTPDTIPDSDTPIVRRTVKQTKDSNQDKDPVHVNVTVVVKKFAGTSKDGTAHTTAEAFVEQKPPQYVEPIQHPPEILPPATTENQEKSEESTERAKSTEHQQLKSSEEKVPEHSDRHTQSDTEQIITDKQKQRRRPKRISRTCQTYESVFRRMEREQQQELRVTNDTEKNIQTRRSQLRQRKISPKKNLPVYLSAESFRLEELLPKQYHQSRRNMSKSSSIARSLSPQGGGKLLILRPTLPFHHSDAVNVQRVCLQYAIDLVPNENFSSGTMPPHRNKFTVLKQPEHMNGLPMISGSSSGNYVPSSKSSIKDKSASNKSDDQTHQRKNGGAV